MILTIKWTAWSMRTYFNFTIFMNCKPLDGILAMIQVKRTNKRHVWSTLTTCCNLHNKSGKLEYSLKCMPLSCLSCLVISMEHNIKINEQGLFSFSINCLVLQIFTVLQERINFHLTGGVLIFLRGGVVDRTLFIFCHCCRL